MADYSAPLEDFIFIMNEVFQLPQQWANNPTLAERIDGETAEAMLNECAKLSNELLAPFSREADEMGCQFDNGEVTTATGHKEAFRALAEGGWLGLTGNPEYGALGMPKALAVLCDEMITGADIGFSLFPMLTIGAALALDHHGSQALKEKYLPKLYAGEWAGSMCLTEPHAGSDLGIIKTKAVDNGDGSYDITGTKIFISGGEHDLSENIIHLVLAKLPDAPAGPKGISLFLVPKFMDDGSRNGVSCGSLEHKMGINASPTCVMNFDSAKGYLVGEINRGLMAMFTMMNYERVGVGIQGIGPAERSYQCAAAYAKERLQGRSSGSAPDKTESILVHPDVRRMLLTMRAFTEASRCFSTYAANQLDIAKYAQSAQEREAAEAMVALLTPVVKAFCTDRGLESCLIGQQVLGGHGYIREWGQEQLVRDVRVTQIYEGTNGIQAMDLLRRKVVPTKGEAVKLLVTEISEFAVSADLPEFMAQDLQNAAIALQSSTNHILTHATPGLIGSTAVYYQDLLGYVIFAYLWAKMHTAANTDSPLHRSKRGIAEFYFKDLLPRTTALNESICNDHSSTSDFEEALF